ncbi:MAG: DMT family transporter [Anaerolineales bacterium]
MKQILGRTTGIGAALSAAAFLGLAPIFGKQAFLIGFSPLLVVAVRTALAAFLLLVLMVLFRRPFLYIYPAGLLGCGLAGAINGIGSILYYLALERLTASVGQLLYSLYPIFLALWLALDFQPPGRITRLRMAIAMLGVLFLTYVKPAEIDWLGVALMLGASAMYALHLPINQRVLYDIPAPTVTLYTLLAMSMVVVPAYLVFDRSLPIAGASWGPVLALSMVTFFSRLTLFLGVKHLGGMQTALLSLSELLITIVVSRLWLHENLLPMQWAGAALLLISIALIGWEKIVPNRRHKSGWLKWLRPPGIPPDITWGAGE